MILTMGEALERMSQRVYENKKSIKQDNLQRRDRVLDMYGIEYYRNADKNVPAKFYISVTPDLVYFERFEFKLIISPLISTAGSGVSSETVTVNPTSLSGSGGGGGATASNGVLYISGGSISGISPNPHGHTTEEHSHSIIAGASSMGVTATSFSISVEGIDVTPYLMAQYPWVSGEGVFPSLEIEKNYDLLEVASDMFAEGNDALAERILRPGYKPIVISGNGTFACTMSVYLKYSHLNR